MNDFGLGKIGITPHGEVHRNLPVDDLVDRAVKKGEGVISASGALTVTTGKYTGRSPDDRYIVDEPSVHDQIHWGKINVPLPTGVFEKLYTKITDYLSRCPELYIFDGIAGADPRHALNVRVVNEFASQNLLISHLLRHPDIQQLAAYVPGFTILSAPGCLADPAVDGVRSEAFIVISFEKRMVLIGATKYGGEIKKSVFSIMNYLLPQHGVFPMHCSANIGPSGDTALFFGLSGTGKTSLSADPNRRLIGDDEHGWSENGVFNFEAGCYAKCINLSREKEPQIYDAVRHGAVVENVVMNPQSKEYDYTDKSITENTRVAYPLTSIPNAELSGMGGHPKTIIFLTADAFGVLPPIARLTHEQAMYHFMSGYTAKLAGTERGIIEPKVTFSSFFGEPFMPVKPMVYANLLRDYTTEYRTNIFLINTGWSGGPYGVGKRIDIALTRAMVTAALNGELDRVQYREHPIFNLIMPASCPDVPAAILDPVSTWADKGAYEKQARDLALKFRENFLKKFPDTPASVRDAGPQ